MDCLLQVRQCFDDQTAKKFDKADCILARISKPAGFHLAVAAR